MAFVRFPLMKNALLQRTVLFICGLFIMAIGVNLSVKANLGVSPISCLPYVYSLRFPLTLGQTTIILNILLIILQMLLLQKKYQWVQLIQIPVVLLFGWFIDITMPMVSWIEPTHYASQTFYCLLSCAGIALGVFFEVKVKLTYLPGEGLAMALCRRFGFEFGKSKIGVDSSLVIAGIFSSLFFMGNVEGIREGTLLAALLVGYMVRLFNKTLPFPQSFLPVESPVEQAEFIDSEQLPNSEKIIVTISRELGSGGHEIGKMIAQKLGVSFYDQELIQLSADRGGFTSAYIQENEQQLAHSFLYTLYEQNYAYIDEQMPPLDALFMVQSKIIRDISKKESCVIVGRCANFVLKDCSSSCFTVFIHADMKFREQRVIKRYQVEADNALKIIEDSDQKRSTYCNHFTGREWRQAANYNLAIDSSFWGIEQTADMIVEAIQQRREGTSRNQSFQQSKRAEQ